MLKDMQSSRRAFIKSIAGLSASALLPISFWLDKYKISDKNIIPIIDQENIKKSEVHLIHTGLTDLDNILGGFTPGQLIVIGGEPRVGKTALALTILRNNFKNSCRHVGIFSCRIRQDRLKERLLYMEEELQSVDFLDWSKTSLDKISTAYKRLEKNPIIDDEVVFSYKDFEQRVKLMKAENDVKLLVVDCLEHLVYRCDIRRRKDVESIWLSLKSLAMDLSLPIVVTMGFSGKLRRLMNKRPEMDDFMYSHGIQENVNTVLLINRSPYFLNSGNYYSSRFIESEIVIAKNKNGKVGTVCTKFNNQFLKFDG